MESQLPRDETPKTSKRRYTPWLGVLGGILIFFPETLPNIWGNMSVYVTSYFYREHGSTSILSAWTLSSFYIGSNIGVNIVPYVTSVGNKTFLIATIIAFNAGVLCMYFPLKYGMAWLLFFIFGVEGLCGGMLEILVYRVLSDISSTSKGKYRSIVCSGFNFGPFVINLLVGFYMNPDNVVPTLVVNDLPVFGETDLIDRVISLVILQGTLGFLCMCMGFCLLFLSLKLSSHEETNTTDLETSTMRNECTQTRTFCEGSQRISNVESKELTSYASVSNVADGSASTVCNEEDYENSKRDMSVTQILKYAPFYIMWFSYGIDIFAKILMNGSYKTYGLRFIKDDHFLINLGSAYSITGGITRVVWGFCLDMFPIKNCLVYVYTHLSLAIFLMYFAPIFDKYLYFFAVLAVASGINQILPTFIVACEAYFGDNDFYKAMGMISTSRLPLSFTIPPIFETLHIHFGWFGPFCCSSSLVIISLYLIVFIIPYVPKRKHKYDK